MKRILTALLLTAVLATAVSGCVVGDGDGTAETQNRYKVSDTILPDNGNDYNGMVRNGTIYDDTAKNGMIYDADDNATGRARHKVYAGTGYNAYAGNGYDETEINGAGRTSPAVR